jgi:hypothetical protein
VPRSTDVLTCRLPKGEAAAFRAYARERGVPVQVAIREAIQPHIAIMAARP